MQCNEQMTHFDLCGWVLFPGSSNVHGEFDVRHDWQGWPSSHLILRRLSPSVSPDAAFPHCAAFCSPTPITRSKVA